MATEKPFLTITGMHRSGTSFLSRALNLSGVYLGGLSSLDSHELLPTAGNAHGNWEHKELQNLADKWLSLNNGTWDNPPSTEVITRELEGNIVSNIQSLYGHSCLASGYKDPRICIYFNSWQQYYPSNTIVIAMFRHPSRVAESLKTRNKFDCEKSLKLWQEYNERLLRILENNVGFLINFDWPLERILSELKEICLALGLLDASHRIQEWFRPEEIHSGYSEIKEDSILKTLSALEERADNNKKYLSRIAMPDWTSDQMRQILRQTISDFAEDIVPMWKSQQDNINRLRDLQTLRNHPLGLLLFLYHIRQDLQKAFPEVKSGQYHRLFAWAGKNGEKNKNLEPYMSWYKAHL